MVIKYSTTFAELFISVVPLFFLQVSIYIIDKENLRWILCLSNSGKNITVTVASSDSVCSPVPTTVSLCAISKMVFWLFILQWRLMLLLLWYSSVYYRSQWFCGNMPHCGASDPNPAVFSCVITAVAAMHLSLAWSDPFVAVTTINNYMHAALGNRDR